MSIRVIQPGMHTTVQDLGRPGHTALGVSLCGAADAISLRVANRLVGNEDSAAALEATLAGPTLEFTEDTIIACAGAEAAIVLTQASGRLVEVAPYRAVSVVAGDQLRLAHVKPGARAGCRVYLAFGGGIETEPELGSRSTHEPSGLGGVRSAGDEPGRALRAGDVLALGSPVARAWMRPQRLSPDEVESLRFMITRHRLAVVAGQHADQFSAEETEKFYASVFRVADRWNRTGLRLAGTTITGPGQIVTEPMDQGAVEIPPDGLPIVLGPDAPPTGGYPVIASVASFCLPALGQRRANDPVAFELVEVRDALAALSRQEAELDRIIPRVRSVSQQ